MFTLEDVYLLKKGMGSFIQLRILFSNHNFIHIIQLLIVAMETLPTQITPFACRIFPI